jgi:hypothetical protein
MEGMDDFIGQRFLRFFGLRDTPQVDADKGSAKETAAPEPHAETAEPPPRRMSEENVVERYRGNPFLEIPERIEEPLEQQQLEQTPAETKRQEARADAKVDEAKNEEKPDEATNEAKDESKTGEPKTEEARAEKTDERSEPKSEEAKREESDDEIRAAPHEEAEQAEAPDAPEAEREEDPEREEEERPAAHVEEDDQEDETQEWKGLRPAHEDEHHEPKMTKGAANESGLDELTQESVPIHHEEPDASQVAEEAFSADVRKEEVTEKTEAFLEEAEEPEHTEVEEAHASEHQYEEARDEEDRPGGAWVMEEAREAEQEETRGLRQHQALGEENRCHGTTAEGTRCLRKPVEGKAYCREHFVVEEIAQRAAPAPAQEEAPVLRGNFGSKIIV